MGLLVPRSHGGSEAPRAVARATFETLAGACGSTFFAWVQHHAPVRLLASSPNRALADRVLPGLAAGELQGAVAFAHLRRPGPPAVTATPVPGGGWELHGTAPWLTAWGLADVVAVAGLSPGGEVVFGLLEARDGRGVRASPPMALAAMEATATVSLELDHVALDDADVISVVPLRRWRALDRAATSQPNPAVFGLAATCTRHLAEVDGGAAGDLEAQWRRLRERAYGLADAGAGPEVLVGLRAEALVVTQRCATALVAATGGRAMARGHPAQRLAREATFYVIQAQSPAVRAATLARLLAPGEPQGA